MTNVNTDTLLVTGPNGPSVKGALSKLHPNSGAILAKASATQAIVLSLFEAELIGYTTASSIARMLENTMQDLHIYNHDPQTIIYNDNKAMIGYIYGDSTAKGVCHMQLRLWYLSIITNKYHYNIYQAIFLLLTSLLNWLIGRNTKFSVAPFKYSWIEPPRKIKHLGQDMKKRI
jgi:hypothetical protein